MKDRAYLTGLILIAITFLFCVISFWLLYCGGFIFAVGVLFVFLSKKPIRTKLLTTILPIVIYLPTTYLFLLAYNHTSPKTFLIPADCEGTIRIVYEEKCGVKLHEENGRLILQFPESGILILNEKFDRGINNDYYLIDKSGKRTKVKEIADFKDSTKKLPFILAAGAGTFGGDGNTKDIAYSDFYLYNKDTAQTDDDRLSKHLDSLMWKEVEDCRTVDNKTDTLKSSRLIGSYNKGKLIFQIDCSKCHTTPDRQMTDQFIFDKLFDRLPKPSEEYFKKFIMNSKLLKSSGDLYSKKLAEFYNSNMNIFFKTLCQTRMSRIYSFILKLP